MKEKLTEHGVIAININHHPGLKRDIDTIRASFVASTIWQVPNTGNYVALGFKTKPSMSLEELHRSAQQYTLKQATPFRYHRILPRMVENFEPAW